MLWARKRGATARERSIYSFDSPDEEPRFAVKRWLAILAIGIVLLGIVAHVSYVRENTIQDARSQGLIAANLLSQNSARLFDMAEYLAVDMESRIAGRSWAHISADRDLWDAMDKAVGRFPYVSAVSVFDAEGVTRFSTIKFPPPDFSVSEREYFRQHQRIATQGGLESAVSRPLAGTWANRTIFFVSRPIRNADGSLRGVVGVSLRTDYFNNFLETFHLPFKPTLQLVRQNDGAVLAREPGEVSTGGEIVELPVRDVVTAGRVTQPLETDSAIITVQRLPQWPVHAVVSFDRAAVDAAWKAAVVDFVVIGAVAVAALIALAALSRGRRASWH